MPAPAQTKRSADPDSNSKSHPDDPTPRNFALNADDCQFTNRTSSVFGSLASLEDKHVQHVRHSDFNEERSLWKSDPDMEDKVSDSQSNRRSLYQPFGRSSPPFSGQEKARDRGRGFKRPHPASCGRGGRGRSNVPGFRTEPGKWCRYDLTSVSSNDMSDKTNSKTALDFLNELKDRKESESMDVEESDMSENLHHIVFKRPDKKDAPAAAGSSASGDADSTFGSSQVVPVPPSQGKILMPEYVIGEKVKKPKPKPSWASSKAATASAETVQLDHIKDVEADTKELPKADTLEMADGIVFKSAKGKGKHHVRKRHTEEEDN